MASEGYSNPLNLPPAPDGWSVFPIEQLCAAVTSGGTPLRSNRSFYEKGTYSWFKTQELKDSKLSESDEKITQVALNQSSAKLFPSGTVLMAMYGDGKTITSLGLLTREAATNQACCAMIPDNQKCDSRFLFYALKYHRSEFIQIATGGAQRNLSGKLIRRFAINTPPLNEQRAIGKILGELDDKIDLNRETNKSLESIARAIYESWFVDFDPVLAKGDGRWRRDTLNAGFPSKLYDHFSDQIMDTGATQVPLGWTQGTLKDIAELNPESWSKATAPATIEYVDLSNTKWGHIESKSKYSWADAPSRAQRVLRKSDTIVGIVRPGNGSYAFVSEDGLTGSTGFAVLRPVKKEYAELIYLAATASQNIYKLAHLADGAAYPSVRPEIVAATSVSLPPNEIVRSFSELTRPLLEKIAATNRLSKTLSEIRDTLIPKLITGEIRVSDAERIVSRKINEL